MKRGRMRRGKRLENLRVVIIALTAMFCVRAFLTAELVYFMMEKWAFR